MMYTVYILHSKKLNRFYTGQTSDFELRMLFHEQSPVHKSTGKANDWELFLKIDGLEKHQAMRIESHIKRMKSSKYIRNLIEYPEMRQKLIEKYSG